MKYAHLLTATFCLVLLLVARPGDTSERDQSVNDSNWTFTYLKATEGNRTSLREFVEKNWFVMDRIAVERGLFKSYQLIENITESGSQDASDWDFIVAVEYFDNQSYADIQEQFEEIRSQHETVLIGGKTFRDLGSVVRSERVLVH